MITGLREINDNRAGAYVFRTSLLIVGVSYLILSASYWSHRWRRRDMTANGTATAVPSFITRALSDSDVLLASWRALQSREHKRRAWSGNFTAAVSQQGPNIDKNRYVDILAYDRSRVHLSARYINANWVHEPKSLIPGHMSQKRWLATQAPLPQSLYDFWSLFLLLPPRDAPRKIVMLTGLVESGRVKCARYFPEGLNDGPMRITDGDARPIEVRLLSTTAPHKTWRQNLLSVGFGSQNSIEVQHFECIAWQDHGVPDSPNDLLALIQAAKGGSQDPPTLVHCSAGVGRTGTYITASFLLDALPALKQMAKRGDSIRLNEPEQPQRELPPLRPGDLHDPVSMTVDHLRSQRCLMVQTMEQFEFIYRCLDQAWQGAES